MAVSADIAFRIDLPHGRCVGVRVPPIVDAASQALLHDDEQAFLTTLSAARKPTWFAGRVALRAAIDDLGLTVGPILKNHQGAPVLPKGICGSISHKRSLAVGLASRDAGDATIGVDLEPVPTIPPHPIEHGWDTRPDISSRVMTPPELARLSQVPERLRRRHVVLHFSIKEALYKALNPRLGRYISFQEATVTPHPEGAVDVQLTLTGTAPTLTAEARWSEIDGHILTTALIRAA